MMSSTTILVAVDRSAVASELAPVVALARTTGSTLHLLHAAPPDTAYVGIDDLGGGYDPDLRDAEMSFDLDLLTKLAAALISSDVGGDIAIETDVIAGPTVEVILARAAVVQSSMIVVVGRTHTAAHRLMLGSTVPALLKAATVPVLVLPRADVEAELGGFRSSLDRLIDHIDRDGSPDELGDLRDAADQQLAEPASVEGGRHLWGQMKHSLERFETDHPSLTRSINDVAYYLSGMGI